MALGAQSPGDSDKGDQVPGDRASSEQLVTVQATPSQKVASDLEGADAQGNLEEPLIDELHVEIVVTDLADPDLLDHLSDLPPGVTEIRLRPAMDSPELRAMVADSEHRVHDYHLLRRGSLLADVIEGQGLSCIGYRQLRQLMRRGHHVSRGAP